MAHTIAQIVPNRDLYPSAIPNLANVPTCFVMVGLPARGKTYISRKLARYLNWIGVTTKVFNVGEFRRKLYGTVNCKHDFFDSKNQSGQKARDQCAQLALDEVIEYLKGEGQVSIFDATNTTQERRNYVFSECKRHGIKTFFIESICDDPEVVEQNILEVKLSSPDYKNIPSEEAFNDFNARIKHYQDFYVPIDLGKERSLSYIKIINVGQKFLVNRIEGYLQSRAVYFLMNIHITPRAIYLTRHGESAFNLKGRIGGDADLSPRGQLYSEKLAEFIDNQNIKDLRVWTSQLKRTIQTARNIDAVSLEQWKALDELDAGVCDGMTYEEIEEKFPDDFARRDQDKYHYRYPRGESYEDLVARLEPVIMELERQQNILVICHQAVMRCLLAYFLDHNSGHLPYLNVPLHAVYKLTPVAYGCRVETFHLNVTSVDTYRKQPEVVKIGRSRSEALGTVPVHEI